MLEKKAILTREIIKTICLTKKLFLNSYQDNSFFFIINSNNIEIIHHIHCFGYIFCRQNKTVKFC